jgi:hypothetical protein
VKVPWLKVIVVVVTLTPGPIVTVPVYPAFKLNKFDVTFTSIVAFFVEVKSNTIVLPPGGTVLSHQFEASDQLFVAPSPSQRRIPAGHTVPPPTSSFFDVEILVLLRWAGASSTRIEPAKINAVMKLTSIGTRYVLEILIVSYSKMVDLPNTF